MLCSMCGCFKHMWQQMFVCEPDSVFDMLRAPNLPNWAAIWICYSRHPLEQLLSRVSPHLTCASSWTEACKLTHENWTEAWIVCEPGSVFDMLRAPDLSNGAAIWICYSRHPLEQLLSRVSPHLTCASSWTEACKVTHGNWTEARMFDLELINHV